MSCQIKPSGPRKWPTSRDAGAHQSWKDGLAVVLVCRRYRHLLWGHRVNICCDQSRLLSPLIRPASQNQYTNERRPPSYFKIWRRQISKSDGRSTVILTALDDGPSSSETYHRDDNIFAPRRGSFMPMFRLRFRGLFLFVRVNHVKDKMCISVRVRINIYYLQFHEYWQHLLYECHSTSTPQLAGISPWPDTLLHNIAGCIAWPQFVEVGVVIYNNKKSIMNLPLTFYLPVLSIMYYLSRTGPYKYIHPANWRTTGVH